MLPYSTPPPSPGPVGVGVANDLCEPGLVKTLHDYVNAGLVDYLTVYVYDNYTVEFMRDLRRCFPERLAYVWHTSGDFEIPYAGDSISARWDRIKLVGEIWNPLWATEDVLVANFGCTRPQGHPNYVPPFLTEECLATCIRRIGEVQRRVPMPFLPEVPHFYMPVPETMRLAPFFRRLTAETGAMLNLDVGHLFSYNLMHRRDPLDGIDEFPLDQVMEINAAGGMVGDAGGLTWIDDYSAPLNPLTVEALRLILPRCVNLRAMYTETIGGEDWVLRYNVEKMNDLFWSHVSRNTKPEHATP